MNLRLKALKSRPKIIHRDYKAQWETKEGKVLFVYQMDSEHIINCIKLMKRRYNNGAILSDPLSKKQYSHVINTLNNELEFRKQRDAGVE